MHEHSLCNSLLARVLEIASREEAKAVKSVTVQIGPLSGIDTTQLVDAFADVCSGTPAHGAALDLETMQLQVYCPSCDASKEVDPDVLDCPSCGSTKTQLVNGTELILVDVELVLEEDLQ